MLSLLTLVTVAFNAPLIFCRCFVVVDVKLPCCFNICYFLDTMPIQCNSSCCHLANLWNINELSLTKMRISYCTYNAKSVLDVMPVTGPRGNIRCSPMQTGMNGIKSNKQSL